MAKRLFSDNAVSLLYAPISASSTSLTVLPGHGSLFPQPGPNEFFTVTLEDQAAVNREIIHVTQRIGDTFTILRGQEGTTARSWSASPNNDTLVDHRLTAASLYYLKDEPANFGYSNPSFPSLQTYKQAIDYLLQNPSSGGEQGSVQVVDAPFTSTVSGNQTIIQVQTPFKLNSVAVFVGGLRQKRGIDFIETSQTEIRLQYPVTTAMQADGQNIVVDFILA